MHLIVDLSEGLSASRTSACPALPDAPSNPHKLCPRSDFVPRSRPAKHLIEIKPIVGTHPLDVFAARPPITVIAGIVRAVGSTAHNMDRTSVRSRELRRDFSAAVRAIVIDEDDLNVGVTLLDDRKHRGPQHRARIETRNHDRHKRQSWVHMWLGRWVTIQRAASLSRAILPTLPPSFTVV